MSDAAVQSDSPPNGNIFRTHSQHRPDQPLFPQTRIHPDFMPTGSKSLSRISEHALGLGIVLGSTTLITFQLAFNGHYLWRLSCFIATLCCFHYLEFDMTARYNPTDARVSSYLLFTNGRAYNIAHSAAILEIITRYWLTSRRYLELKVFSDSSLLAWMTFAGLIFIIVGQLFRSLAMKQAGTSFNHIVQSSRREDHNLVTSGVYSISRHPAYLGFFLWGIGTQLMLGNLICLIGYSAILWKFFSRRIMHEEKFLVSFFGDDFERYRERTPVLIPFIT